MTERIVDKCKAQNVFLNPDGMKKNIIKVKPPMIFTKSNVDQLYKALEIAFRDVEEEDNINNNLI